VVGRCTNSYIIARVQSGRISNMGTLMPLTKKIDPIAHKHENILMVAN